MFLVDTNIFLEILLAQDKSKACKNFLEEKRGELSISDFSLHSIGVILFRNKKEDVFNQFVNDVLVKLEIHSLDKELYKDLFELSKEFNLDFDDAYQYKVAIENKLTIATMDNDFNKVSESVSVLFL